MHVVWKQTDVYVLKINLKKKKKEWKSWNTMNALLPLLSDDDDIKTTFGAKINKSFIKRHCQINLDSFVHFSAQNENHLRITRNNTIESIAWNSCISSRKSTFHVAVAALCSLLVRRKIISFSGKHSRVYDVCLLKCYYAERQGFVMRFSSIYRRIKKTYAASTSF